jgi:hypothetical protein
MNPDLDPVDTPPGADHPHQPVPIPTGELHEWRWLLRLLAEWLTDPAEIPHTDYHLSGPSRHHLATTCRHVAERISGLLDGDHSPA